MVQSLKIIIDGKETVIPGIFKDGVNYPNLRALAEVLGVGVDYDAARKAPVLTSPKK